MFRLSHDKNGQYRKFFLCFIFSIVLIVCTVYEKPELDKISYAGFGNSSSITSPETDTYDIFTNEYTGYAVVKGITSRNSVAGRFTGSKTTPVYAVINSLFVLIGTFVLYHIYFLRSVSTSHRWIVAYIHDLDGMKP